jgi:hypothetical protein
LPTVNYDLPAETPGIEAISNSSLEQPPKKCTRKPSKDTAAKPKKSRGAKGKDVQTKLKAGQITKPGKDSATAKDVATAKSRKKRTSTGSTKATKAAKPVEADDEPDPPSSLQLKEAVRRRLDWTPPRETCPAATRADPSVSETAHSFPRLLESFGYEKDGDNLLSDREPPCPDTMGDEGLSKRRRVMVSDELWSRCSRLT